MSDVPVDQEQSGNEKEDNTPVTNPVAVTIAQITKESVDKAQTDGTIQSRVVSYFADEKINERVNLLTKALKSREDKWKEFQKLKPDMVFFTDNGQEEPRWSKDGLKKRQELEKALNKMDKAINRAIESADYEGLKKYAQ